MTGAHRARRAMCRVRGIGLAAGLASMAIGLAPAAAGQPADFAAAGSGSGKSLTSSGFWLVLAGGTGAVAALAGTAAANASGGGGGSNDDTTDTVTCGGSDQDADAFRSSSEFQAQWGLASIDAAPAYAEGCTGSSARLAVADTGQDIEHSEFATQLDLAASRDYYGEDGTLDLDGAQSRRVTGDLDANGHGTHVTGIASAERGNDASADNMHGVAWEATVVPYAVLDSAGALSRADAERIFPDLVDKMKREDIDVVNNSWGRRADVTDFDSAPVTRAERQAWEDAARAGIAVVFAAGNRGGDQLSPADNPTPRAGLPYYGDTSPQLSDHWLAVAAHDRDGELSDFSYRCGVAAAWCLAAPGREINSATQDGGYASRSGTSQAAPHAAGAIATLLDHHGEMTPAQAIERLLTSADQDFAAYDRDLYGQGRLDLGAAMAPMGTLTLALPGNRHGDALAASRLHPGSAVGDGLARSLAGEAVLTRDQLGGTFAVAADELVAQPGQAPGPGAPAPARRPASPPMAFAGNLAITSTRAITRSATPLAPADPLVTAVNQDAHATAGPSGMSLRLGKFHEPGAPAAAFYAAPGHDAADAPITGLLTGLAWPVDARQRASLRVGVRTEPGGLLGTTGEGVLATAAGTTHTIHAGLTTSRRLPGGWRVHARGELGLSRYADGGALVRRSSGVVTTSAAVVGTQAPGWLNGDRLSLSLAQPLRVERGTVTLRLPRAPSAAGTRFADVPGELTPSGREAHLQARYAVPVAGGEVAAAARLRHAPGHRRNAAPTAGLMLHVGHRF